MLNTYNTKKTAFFSKQRVESPVWNFTTVCIPFFCRAAGIPPQCIASRPKINEPVYCACVRACTIISFTLSNFSSEVEFKTLAFHFVEDLKPVIFHCFRQVTFQFLFEYIQCVTLHTFRSRPE